MRYYTAGESHGQGLVAIVEDVPAGLKISEEQINVDLARRQAGYGRGGRMKIEHDTVQVISGVRFGRTIGSPVAMLVANRDWANWTDRMAPFGEPPLDLVREVTPQHPRALKRPHHCAACCGGGHRARVSCRSWRGDLLLRYRHRKRCHARGRSVHERGALYAA